MIEGLRQAPWLQLAAQRDRHRVALFLDCATCKGQMPKETRRLLACVFEEPHPSATPWIFPDEEAFALFVDAETGKPNVATCPGHATRMLEVIERQWQLHWMGKGGYGMLTAELGGEPDEDDMAALRVLESMRNEAQSWALEHPPAKEGT